MRFGIVENAADPMRVARNRLLREIQSGRTFQNLEHGHDATAKVEVIHHLDTIFATWARKQQKDLDKLKAALTQLLGLERVQSDDDSNE